MRVQNYTNSGRTATFPRLFFLGQSRKNERLKNKALKKHKKVWLNAKKVVPLHPQSVYCAGSDAINALKKSSLTFKCEEVGAPFLSAFVCEEKWDGT